MKTSVHSVVILERFRVITTDARVQSDSQFPEHPIDRLVAL